MLIAPSMLACDFSHMADEVKKIDAAGADLVHLDVMDGHFVPNLSFGPAVIAALRPHTKLPFDVHLMLSHPLAYIRTFAKSGADLITFHVECEDDPAAVIEEILACGCKPGLAVKPGTPVEALFPYADKLAMALVMTVEPGFGGQSFMADMMPKIRTLKEKFPALTVEADGGIGPKTIDACREAGLDIAVAGSSVFSAEDTAQAISVLK